MAYGPEVYIRRRGRGFEPATRNASDLVRAYDVLAGALEEQQRKIWQNAESG
jgi:hypothetical protein